MNKPLDGPTPRTDIVSCLKGDYPIGHNRQTYAICLQCERERLERSVAELEELLREIRPQVDIVRGSWFDRTDAILARLDGSKP